MNAYVKEAFTNIKPVCDILLVYPSLEILEVYISRIADLNDQAMQDLQQFLLYPLIARLKGNEMGGKEEVLLKMLAALKLVVERISIDSFEMFVNLETTLLTIIYDYKKHEIISATSEEVKLAVLECLIATMLHIPYEIKHKMLKTQVPMLAQTVFVSVHIAKLERMRALKLAALENVLAHTLTHPQLTTDYHITDEALELSAVDNMLSSILPGVVAALQDVAMARENQGHLIIVKAIEAIHRVLCLAMHDKYLPAEPALRTQDLIRMVKEKKKALPEVSNKDQNIKDLKKRSQEWFDMAQDKLSLVTMRLCSLRPHSHVKVRKELAVFCYRLMGECTRSMASSHHFCLDVLISYTKDDHPELSEYACTALRTFLGTAASSKLHFVSTLADNFLAVVHTFPKAMNCVDSSSKQSALDLLHGHIAVLSDGSRPQRLTSLLSVAGNMVLLCTALCHAARHASKLAILTRHAKRDVSTPPPLNSPWSTFVHLDSKEAVQRLQEICQLLGASECSELIVDSLLEQFRTKAEAETVFICNWMASDPKAPVSLSRRLLNTYLEEDVWNLPLEVDSGDAPVGKDETLDPTVYDPRAWTKDSVPDLYEGAIEIRYTDISYAQPRLPVVRALYAEGTVGSVGEAQRNLVLSCLLTEGVGLAAERLGQAYQLYLLRTLCLILERIGSEYELLQLAGLKAIHAIAKACGHDSPAELIKANADYFTNQITVSLKKSWNCQSALQILAVVMEYSDASILDCMYGIVEHVLVQSCDMYYEHNMCAYLQVFLTFVECIRNWFPSDEPDREHKKPEEIDLLAELNEYVRETQEAERLLSDSDVDSGRELEETYREDLQSREENELDYDDRVTEEKPPIPQHVRVSLTILTRSVHFLALGHRCNAILAMQVLDKGLPVLARYEDVLLPLVHVIWAPLVTRFDSSDPVLLRRAFDLLVTLAALAKDFIQRRAVKEVLQEIYKFLHKSAKDSLLKDKGSYYRTTQAYHLQEAALEALPRLASDLGLEDDSLQDAMACVDAYLSKKQPKPLQQSAVAFFKTMLEYSYGAAWYHLRELCSNDAVITPPELHSIKLEPLVGTPFQARDLDYDANIKRIFDYIACLRQR